MERFFESLRPAIRLATRHPASVALAALFLAAIALLAARGLTIDTDIANLIPDDYPSKIALERLKETVGGESDVAVGITSPSFEANKAFAEALIPAALAMKGADYQEPYLTRVEYRKDTDFLKGNALYFATEAELDLLESWLEGKIEDSRLEANPFFFDLDDEDDEETPDTVARELEAIYEDLVSKEYPISDDSTTMALRFYPAGSQTNIQYTQNLYDDLGALVASIDPTRFHPDMTVILAGRLQRSMIEVQTIQQDVVGSFGAGVLAVLFMVLVYFAFKSYRARAGRRLVPAILLAEIVRMPVLGLVIAVPLLISLSWTFGLAALTFGSLNLMTSTLGLVLFGLGIDFGIHFYARYAEERGEGRPPMEAAEETFRSTGLAITVGAVSTASALFVLMAADFRGFSQFGFIAGTGIIFALLCMLTVMPALLVLFERVRLLNFERGSEMEQVSTAPGRLYPFARPVLMVSILMVAAALFASGNVQFEYRFGELEPTYAEYDARNEVIRRVFSSSRGRNPAYIVLDDSSEVRPVLSALTAQIAADTLSPTVDRVETLQERFPQGVGAQSRRLGRLAAIRALLADPFLETDDSEDMDRLRRASSTTEPVPLGQVPDFLTERFTSKSGQIGNFIIIYPSVGLSDGRQSIAFSDDIGRVETAEGRVYHAGSSPLVAADMLRLMRSEAPWMVLATLIIVAALMWITFGSARWAMLALLPLVVGVLWMLLMVEVFGLRLNFYNLIVLPAVLGIGNDAGVHLVSRYRELGRGSVMQVIRSTGEHVTMGSMTTMVGFAGLLLSFHPGLNSIGQLAVVGIGATLLAALLFLPALLQTRESRETEIALGSIDE